MKTNGESVYGTQASPFRELRWGRCTQKSIKGGTRLYFHVFDWPAVGKLKIPGIYNEPKEAFLLSDQNKNKLVVKRNEDALEIQLPDDFSHEYVSVVVLDVQGKLDINDPPLISAESEIFIDSLSIKIISDRENIDIRYTTDGSVPDGSARLLKKPVLITESTTVTAGIFRDGKPVSGPVSGTFKKVIPWKNQQISGLSAGLRYRYFEGDWNRLPEFNRLEPVKKGVIEKVEFSPRSREEYFGFVFEGFIKVPREGIHSFFIESDDGSRFYLDGKLLIDNDGLHGMTEKAGAAPLSAGFHSVKIEFFQKTGGKGLKVSYKISGGEIKSLSGGMLFCRK